jgi:hypothetical protein
VRRWIENFLGLKSRIFITAEFILRHESSSETCLEGSTFIYHEGAKTRSRLRPQNIITPALPGGSACPLILRGQFRWVWSHNWEFKKEVKKLEMRILNYEFSFCLFFFAGVDIHLSNCSSSAFQAVMVGTSLSAGRDLRLWRLLPFRQRLAGELKASTAMDIFCIREYFWLEKPNFHNRGIYSAARIVVGNLPGRQYFYLPRRRKDAKLASSSEYHNPCTAWRQCLSPYLKGTVNGKCDLAPLLR